MDALEKLSDVLQISPENVKRIKGDVERLKTNKEEAEKFRKEYKEAQKGFEEHQPVRSRICLEKSVEVADGLKADGKSKYNNVMCVIGADHAKDYIKAARLASEGKTDYNLVLIYPKGLDTK